MNRAWLCVVVLACAVTGCMAENPSGDLRAVWSIGLDEPTSASCDEAGIASVELAVRSGQHDVTEISSCQSGQRTFRQLPVASYTVTISGLDGNDCPIYEGSATNVTPGDPGLPEDVTIALERLPTEGTVSVEWMFEDGRLCGTHGVDQVTVTLMSDDVEILTTFLDCEQGTFETLAVPSGAVDVSITATQNGTPLCHVETGLDLVPCGDLSVLAILEPCE